MAELGGRREHLRQLIRRESGAAPSAVLTPADVETLERIGIAATAALLLDLRGGDGGRRAAG